MKKITFIAILLLCICSLTKAKEKVIEQPPFIAWTSTSIQVDKVVLSDSKYHLLVRGHFTFSTFLRSACQYSTVASSLPERSDRRNTRLSAG